MHFVPWGIFGLGVLGKFNSKNQTRKIVKIDKNFELYQVFMSNCLCQTVLFTKIIETFWSTDVTDIRVLAHFKSLCLKLF